MLHTRWGPHEGALTFHPLPGSQNAASPCLFLGLMECSFFQGIWVGGGSSWKEAWEEPELRSKAGLAVSPRPCCRAVIGDSRCCPTSLPPEGRRALSRPLLAGAPGVHVPECAASHSHFRP